MGQALTDLEISKRCAAAMGHEYIYVGPELCIRTDRERGAYTKIPLYRTIYDPLRDDAQAMALVKKFELEIIPPPLRAVHKWRVVTVRADTESGSADNLNRAICECVAKMQCDKPSTTS